MKRRRTHTCDDTFMNQVRNRMLKLIEWLALVYLGLFCYPIFASGYSNNIIKGKYIGLLIPVGPDNYSVITHEFIEKKQIDVRRFTYQIGTIYGVPVILCIQPFGGEFTRALTAQVMVDKFNVKALLYPGTSGAHLRPDKMRVGDIVIGTKQVNFGDFYMSPSGKLFPDEFLGKSSLGDYQYFYLNKTLEKYAACAAENVAKGTALPQWINGNYKTKRPRIFYYGIQGTSTMWLADKKFMRKTDRVFHEVDEDGDWFSATVARLANIPFIEVSTISDSVFEFPGRGIPTGEQGHKETAAMIAQSISDKIILNIIKNYGVNILNNKYPWPKASPFPKYYYSTPQVPRGLVKDCR